VDYEIQRQSERLSQGLPVVQETMGWDEAREVTVSQRGKEEAHDYRYFPEPDLPPLVVDSQWVEALRAGLPELPEARFQRFRAEYGLGDYDADLLAADKEVADYFEAALASASGAAPKTAANWITGEFFSLLNQAGMRIDQARITPQALGELILMVERGEINQSTAKKVLAEMFVTGEPAGEIVSQRGLGQISDRQRLSGLVTQVLEENPEQVNTYLEGKEGVINWLFGQVMRAVGGRANPQVVRQELQEQLSERKSAQGGA
jgi:aspartyl-tRNA(Asn)/glutamyl-tRNA(Gln) amidotransferase subunit B